MIKDIKVFFDPTYNRNYKDNNFLEGTIIIDKEKGTLKVIKMMKSLFLEFLKEITFIYTPILMKMF
jgi:hypothetical protein